MKRVLAVLAVVAMMGVSSIAMAADISVGGQIDIRGRNFNNLDLYKNSAAANNTVDTQERVRLEVNVKGDGASGKISIENDMDTWGRIEHYQANGATTTPANGNGSAWGASFLMLREAWMAFMIPDTPVGVKGGHMLLQLSNGWFFRSMKYGSDAWVVYTDPTPQLHLGVVDIKASEGASNKNNDDIDAYAFVGTFKINDKNTVGANITFINDRAASLLTPTVTAFGRALGGLTGNTNPFQQLTLQNYSLHYGGMLGPVNLKAELDIQNGKAKLKDGIVGDDAKLSGNQIVLEGTVPLDPVVINFTVARGSGIKTDDLVENSKIGQMVTIMDYDPHYTFLFEYKVAHAMALAPVSQRGMVNFEKATQQAYTGDDMLHFGFANTTALNVGVSGKITKTLTIGANLWYLQSTEKITNGLGDDTHDLGTEIDGKINWQMTPSLNWTTDLGYFKPGTAYKYTAANGDEAGKDAATGIQSMLSFKF